MAGKALMFCVTVLLVVLQYARGWDDSRNVQVEPGRYVLKSVSSDDFIAFQGSNFLWRAWIDQIWAHCDSLQSLFPMERLQVSMKSDDG